jgi:hypothetical protein
MLCALKWSSLPSNELGFRKQPQVVCEASEELFLGIGPSRPYCFSVIYLIGQMGKIFLQHGTIWIVPVRTRFCTHLLIVRFRSWFEKAHGTGVMRFCVSQRGEIHGACFSTKSEPWSYFVSTSSLSLAARAPNNTEMFVGLFASARTRFMTFA